MLRIRKYLQGDKMLYHFHHSSILNKQRYFHAELQGEVAYTVHTELVISTPSPHRHTTITTSRLPEGGRSPSRNHASRFYFSPFSNQNIPCVPSDVLSF